MTDDEQSMELVEDEAVEHAYLDFMEMELGLDNALVVSGSGFECEEEGTAHAEIDSWLDYLQNRSQGEDCGGGDQEDVVGVLVDKYSSVAYYGGGTWWLDRWRLVTSEKGAKHVKRGGHGKNVAMGVCSILSAHVVRPSQKSDPAVQCTNMLNNFECSGHLKRKLSGRSGRWWPSSGWSTTLTPTRRPWRSTRLASLRLRNMQEADKKPTGYPR